MNEQNPNKPTEAPALSAADLDKKSTSEILQEAMSKHQAADKSGQEFEKLFEEMRKLALEDGVIDRQEAIRLYQVAHQRDQHNATRLANAQTAIQEYIKRVRPGSGRRGGTTAVLLAAVLLGTFAYSAYLDSSDKGMQVSTGFQYSLTQS